MYLKIENTPWGKVPKVVREVGDTSKNYKKACNELWLYIFIYGPCGKNLSEEELIANWQIWRAYHYV